MSDGEADGGKAGGGVPGEGPGDPVTIYYDGDCPVCTDYVRYLRLREAAGTPVLVDLRKAPEKRAELEAEGFDPDRGMVAEIGGRRYEGADALHALALLTGRSGLFNRITARLFGSSLIARTAYPLLRAGRNTLLTLLGRKPFREGDEGWLALFTLFSLLFGLFAIVHFTIYAFRYTAFEVHPSGWAILVLGALLFLRPGSRRLFALLVVAMAVDGWLHAPVQSNHTMLRNFLLLALLGSGAWHLLRGSRWSDFFRDAVPVGRVLLLVMYFYGVFHKINTGFLDPETSCAVALWRVLPQPLAALDHPFVHYTAIYGTLVVETVIALMLVIGRLRRWGVVLGIAFHCLLAFSAFAMYPPFTTLAIALHVLFLSPAEARRIVAGSSWRALVARFGSWQGWALLAVCLPLLAWFAIARDLAMVSVVWLLLALPPLVVLLLPGRVETPPPSPGRSGPLLWSRLAWLNLVGLLFLFNGATPYLGLKTAQSLAMFSNLRVEGGVNNHLVLRGAPGPFRYLDEVVMVEAASGDRFLERIAGTRFGVVPYHLLDRLDRNPGATATFTRAGVRHENASAETLADEIAATLHPRWVRKWFHFRRVHTGEPTPCT